MSLDPRLLEVLACPDDKGPLYYFEAEQCLYNPRLRRKYSIIDDIPVMLIEEATSLSDDEHDALMAIATERGLLPTFAA